MFQFFFDFLYNSLKIFFKVLVQPYFVLFNPALFACLSFNCYDVLPCKFYGHFFCFYPGQDPDFMRPIKIYKMATVACVGTMEYRKGWSSPVQGFSHNPQTGVDAVPYITKLATTQRQKPWSSLPQNIK
jgi:hypothetical protein